MSLPKDSDEALVQRFAQGDAAAFEHLYRRHEMRLWRYLRRNLRDAATADELLQEVWFAVARDAARYEPTAPFTTWLFTIARHRVIDWLRAERRRPAVQALDGVELAAPAASSPLARVVADDQAAALIAAVEGLPSDQRDCFLLQVEGDLSVEAIAAITHSSFETTKSRLRYARAKLKESLKDYA